MNTRFEYLYRDGGNGKNWGEIVFSNPRKIRVRVLKEMLGEALISGLYFVSTRVGVPDLHFPDYDPDVDHGWHELHDIVATPKAPTAEHGRSIDEFLESLRFACSTP